MNQRTGLDVLEERKICCLCHGWSPNPVCKFWRRGKYFATKPNRTVGRDSSVSIVTHYGLDSPRSNPGGGVIFRTSPDQP